MKGGGSDKSRKDNKQHLRSKRHEGDSRSNSNKYHNVLKERPYREVSEPDRRKKNRQNDSRSDKGCTKTDRNRPSQPPKQLDHKKSSSGTEKQLLKGRKHASSKEESYEELSRKKRKIESELQALDLEEAAAAERRRAQKRSSEPSKKKDTSLHVKKEPLSDEDESRRRTQAKSKQNSSVANGDRNPRRPQSSNTSDHERSWGNMQTEPKKEEKLKEKPDFAVSGKLAEDTNTYNGVVIKYNEPSEARKPRRRWRLYPFKGDTEMPFIPIHRQSAYLFGRTRSIADIPIDHPSCSKQHAVLQFRLVPYQREDGTKGRRVRPYIIDLESSNGTFVNNKKIGARCYVELMEKDVIKFGFSTREYVILHEESRNDEEDDDILDSN